MDPSDPKYPSNPKCLTCANCRLIVQRQQPVILVDRNHDADEVIWFNGTSTTRSNFGG